MLFITFTKRLLPLYLVLAVSAYGVSGCSKHETSFDHLSKAQQYYQHGQNAAAVIELKNAIRLDPNNGEARYLLAVIRIERGEASAAEIELHKARELGVDKNKVDVALGQALLLQGKYPKVLDDVKPSGKLEGQLAAAIYTARGNAFLGLGKPDDAKSSFDKALAADADYADAYLGMARLDASKKDLDAALHQVEVALSKSPKSVLAWTMKGDALVLQGKEKDAEAAYNHVLQIDKDNVPVRTTLAIMYIGERKYDEAKAKLDAAQKLDPDDQKTKYVRAIWYFQKGQYTQARDTLEDLMKGSTDYAPGNLLHGVINYQLGSYEQARKDLALFLLKIPGNLYAKKYLASTDLKMNDPGAAIKDMGDQLSTTSSDPDILALGGQIYMQAKDYVKATEYLERAAKLEPKNANVRVQLGVNRMLMGEQGRAVAEFESAVKLGSNQFTANALLVEAQLQGKEYDKAIETAEAWRKQQQDNPIVYNLEGVAYLAKKDVSTARKRFEKAITLQPTYIPAVENLARLDLQANDTDAAINRFKDVLKSDHNNLRAMVEIANISMVKGRNQDAVNWLDKAINAHPSDMLPRQLLVGYYLRTGKASNALNAARDALNINQGDPKALALLGSVQNAVGDKKGLLDTYTKLVSALPNSATAYFGLAKAQQGLGKFSDAEASLEKVVELKPDFLEAYAAMGGIKLQRGKYDEALKVAEDLKKKFPKSPLGLDLEGNVLMKQKKYSAAAKVYAAVRKMTDNSVSTIQLYNAYALGGDEKRGEAVLLERLKNHPGDTAVHLALGQSYMNQDKRAQAIDQYNTVLKRMPNNIIALNNLAWLYLKQKDHRAIDTAERAYKVSPTNSEIADTYGWILVANDQSKQGAEILKRAIALDPKNPTITYHYASALAKTGNKIEAREKLEKLLKSGQPFAEKDAAKKLLDRL